MQTKVVILKNPSQVGEEAASILLKEIKKKPKFTLGLSSGSTMLPFFRHFISKKPNLKKVTTFNLDEYVGLNKNNKESLFTFMNRNFFKKTNLKKENINFLNGKENHKKECRRYESEIKKSGIGLQILGIGKNAHIAFNEPGSSFQSKTRKVKLSKTARKDNSRFFNSKNQVPKYALTMGIKTILQAKKIILLATGKHKADAVAKALQRKPTTKIPASALQKHRDVTFVLDRTAASKLKKNLNKKILYSR